MGDGGVTAREMASAAAAARAGRRRVTHRQGAQGGAWQPATAASRRHLAALTVPPRRAGVRPLVAGARSARTRTPKRIVAAVAITARRGGRGRHCRCRPHPPLWLTTATGARHPPAGDAAANTRAARGAAAGGHLGVSAGGGGGGGGARGGGGGGGDEGRCGTQDTTTPSASSILAGRASERFSTTFVQPMKFHPQCF